MVTKRKNMIGINVSEDEKAVIESEAYLNGMTTAAYCRQILMGYIRSNNNENKTERTN